MFATFIFGNFISNLQVINRQILTLDGHKFDAVYSLFTHFETYFNTDMVIFELAGIFQQSSFDKTIGCRK